MNKSKHLNIDMLILTCLICFMSIQISAQSRLTTNAIYQDANNQKSEWKILESGTLIWDGVPYIPFGFKVIFKSLETPDVTAMSQEDKDIISNLSSNGVKDIIISNGYQLINSNPKVLQEIIDTLEQNKISYGIDIGGETSQPLKGFNIDTSLYRLDGPYPETTITRMWNNVDSGIFVVVSKTDGEIIEKGTVLKNPNGQVTIKISKPLDSTSALIVYPQITYYNNFDIWQGYNELRDNIIAYFKDVRLGSSFRFFQDPFNAYKLTFADKMKYLIPNNSQFSLGYENYLTKNHFHKGNLANSWGMMSSLDDMSLYLKLIPLWAPSRGIPSIYNSTTGEFISVNTNASTYWADLSDYRNQSVRYYMDSISDVLRKNIANTPVVFSAEEINNIYDVNFVQSSPDGFSYNYGGKDQPLLNKNMSLLQSYSSIYPKTTWLTVANPKINNNDEIMSVINSGYKGFYWNYDNSTDIQKIKQIEASIDKTNISNYKPTVIAFPIESNVGITPQLLDSTTCWFPTPKPASTYTFGNDIFGYNITGSNDYVIWSRNDNTTITFPGIKDKKPTAVYPVNLEIKKIKSKSKSVQLYSMIIGKKPVVLKNISFTTFFPKEIAESEMLKLEELSKKYDTDDDTTKKLQKVNRDKIKDVLKNGSFANAYGMTREAIEKYLMVYGSDIWINSTSLRRNSFSNLVSMAGASNGIALLLDEAIPSPLSEYYASTTINIRENKSYDLWIAVSDDSISSDFEINCGGNPWMTINKESKISYGNNFSWYKVGNVNLYSGNQNIDIKVTKPNSTTNKYYLAIDAIALIQSDFTPKDHSKPDFVIYY